MTLSFGCLLMLDLKIYTCVFLFSYSNMIFKHAPSVRNVHEPRHFSKFQDIIAAEYWLNSATPSALKELITVAFRISLRGVAAANSCNWHIDKICRAKLYDRQLGFLCPRTDQSYCPQLAPGKIMTIYTGNLGLQLMNKPVEVHQAQVLWSFSSSYQTIYWPCKCEVKLH